MLSRKYRQINGGVGVDSCSRQRPLRVDQLGAESLRPVPGNGGAYLAQRGAGRLLHLAHLLTGPVRVGRQEPRGELGLQHDHRQGVAEQVVQVTCDAFPLGDRGQPLDLLVRPSQPRLGAGSFAVNDPCCPDHQDEHDDRHNSEESPRHGSRGDQERHPGEPGQHSDRHDGPSDRGETSGEGRGVDDEHTRRGIDQGPHHSEPSHRGQQDRQASLVPLSEAGPVQGQEGRDHHRGRNPVRGSGVRVERRLEDQRDEVHQPQVGGVAGDALVHRGPRLIRRCVPRRAGNPRLPQAGTPR